MAGLIDIAGTATDIARMFFGDKTADNEHDFELKKAQIADMLSARTETTERMKTFYGPLSIILYAYAIYLVAAWVLPVFGHEVPPMSQELASIARTLIVGIVAESITTGNDIQLGENGKWLKSPAGKSLLQAAKEKRR